MQDLLYGLALALGILSSTWDIRERRVPNFLTFTAAALSLVTRAAAGGWHDVAWGVAGAVLGLLLLLPLFVLRGMGGGDVKLLAAFGACLGPRLVAWTGIYGALAGGLMAVVVTLWHGVFRRTLSNVALLTMHWRVVGFVPAEGLTLETSHGPKLPYAIPLTVGMVVAIWLKG